MKPEKLNPILGLPAARAALDELTPREKAALAKALLAIRAEAEAKAQESWRRRKGPMAAYWLAGGVYMGHIARYLRRA